MCRLLVCFSFFQFIAAHHLLAPFPSMSRVLDTRLVRSISEIPGRFSLALSRALPVIGFLDPVLPANALPEIKILSTIEEPSFPRRRRFESCPDTATTSALLLQTPLTVCHNESCYPVQPQKDASENEALLLSRQPTAKKAGSGFASLMACTLTKFRPRTQTHPVAADTEQPLESPPLSPQSLQRRGSILSEIFEDATSLHDHWDETPPNVNDATNAPDLKINGLLSSIQNSKVYQTLLTKELEAITSQTTQITQQQMQEATFHNVTHTVISTCNIDKNSSILLTVEVAETIPFTSCVVMKNASITHDNTSAMAPGEQLTNPSSGFATSHGSVYTAQDTKELFNKVLSELKERAAKEPFELHVPNNRFDPPKMTNATDVLQAFFCALRHVTPIAYTMAPHSRVVRPNTQKQPLDKPSVRKHRPAFSQLNDTTSFRVSAQSKHVAHRLTPKKIPYAFYSGLPLLLTKNQTFISFYQSKRFQKQNEELIEEKVLQRRHAHTKDSAPAKQSKTDKTINKMSHLQKEPDDQDKIPQEKPQALQPFRNERSQEINCWIKRIALSTTFITLGAFLITLLKLSLF